VVKDDICKFFSQTLLKKGYTKEIKSTDIEEPHLIQNKLCSVITVSAGIEAAEMLCHSWHGKNADHEKLKCQIHPYSCMGDRIESKSNHPFYTPAYRRMSRS